MLIMSDLCNPQCQKINPQSVVSVVTIAGKGVSLTTSRVIVVAHFDISEISLCLLGYVFVLLAMTLCYASAVIV